MAFRAPKNNYSAAFSNTVASTPYQVTFANTEFKVVLSVSVDSFLRFDGGAATSADLFIAAAQCPVEVTLYPGAQHVSALGATASGRVAVFVPGAAEEVSTILGDLYQDEWTSEQGLTAASWTSRGGRVLTATGAPTVAADGTSYRSKPVANIDGSSSYLGTVAALANNGHPYVVFAWRTIDHFATFAEFGTGAATHEYQFRDLSTTYKFGIANADVVTNPVNPGSTGALVHVGEIWHDGSLAHMVVDGVAATANSTASTVPVTRVLIGGGGMGITAARLLFASAAPTAAQRAQLLALYNNQLGI